MKRLAVTPFLFALMLLLAPASVQAGEPIEALKGSWLAESMGGEAPPAGITMVMTFVDDKTMSMEVTFAGETQKEEIKYEATADGKITIFPEPDEKPEGDKATWEVKDGKLTIKTEEGDTLVFKKQG